MTPSTLNIRNEMKGADGFRPFSIEVFATLFLLEGLNAGKTTPRQLAEYLTPRVLDEAHRLNRDQTPQLQGDGDWSLR